MFKKLRNRFLVLNMSIISIMMITAFTVIYFITYSNMQTGIQNRLSSTAITQMENTNQPQNHGGGLTVSSVSANNTPSFSTNVNKEGEIEQITSYIEISNEIIYEATELAWENQNNGSIISLDKRLWQYNIIPVNNSFITYENGKQSSVSIEGEKYQITFLDVTDMHKTLRNLLMTFILVGLVMLVCIFFISLYFANRAINPIVEAWEKQKQFVADASHELKTPLAIIHANSDALLSNQEETIKSQKKWLDYIKAETVRMTKLINGLLYLAKTEDVSIRTLPTSFDISDAVTNSILSMEALVFESGLKLSYTIEPDIIVKSDPEKIKQVVIILLENAIKYTNKYGAIEINLKKTKRQVVFSIKNSGKGISKKDLPKLFDRFYRTDPSRAQATGGYGLGLSVAKAIMDSLGGKIYAASVENESTTFTFVLKQ